MYAKLTDSIKTAARHAAQRGLALVLAWEWTDNGQNRLPVVTIEYEGKPIARWLPTRGRLDFATGHFIAAETWRDVIEKAARYASEEPPSNKAKHGNQTAETQSQALGNGGRTSTDHRRNSEPLLRNASGTKPRGH